MLPQDAGLPDPGGRLPMPARDPLPVAGRIEPVAAVRPTFPPEPPPALAASPDLMSMLQALRRRWISAVLLGGTLSAITAVAVWFLVAPKAVAFAKVRVAFDTPVVL